MVKQRNGRSRLETEGLFIVEAIVDRRRVEENRLQYLIKWRDYPSSHNTWEYAANVAHCKEIIAEFRELRLSEGFVDSEDEGPPPPPLPPIQVSPTTRKRRRKRKSETSSSACQSRMSNDSSSQNQTPIPPLSVLPPPPQPSSQANQTSIVANDSNNSLDDLHHRNNLQLSITSPTVISIPQKNPFQLRPNISATTTTAGINLNNAIKIFAATFNSNGKYFCTLFSDGSKFWISNEHCRKYLPQLLLDYYENCSVFIETTSKNSSSSKDEEKQNNFMQEKFMPYEKSNSKEAREKETNVSESSANNHLNRQEDVPLDVLHPMDDSSTLSLTSVPLD